MTSFTNIRNRAFSAFSSSLSKAQNIWASVNQKIDNSLQTSSKLDPNISTGSKYSLQTDLVKPGNEKPVGYWLLAVAALVYGMICLGAYTRLIKFGHSFTGLHPTEWKGEFDTLQKYVEHFLWRKPSPDLALTFLDEYLSTIFERVIGFCFIVPFSYFLLTGKLAAKLRNRCFALMAMQFLQGYIGAWIAVQEVKHKHHFHERTLVSTYRMVVHWNTTMIMFAVLFWNGLSLVRSRQSASESNHNDINSMRKKMIVASAIHALNFATGVMVAGIDGSKQFNTFPTMDGHIIPDGYLRESPIWRDLFENIATVQFHHRLFAYGTYAISAYLFIISRKANLPGVIKKGLLALLIIVNLQLVDGLCVLFTKGHWIAGIFHQSNAIWIVAASLFTLHAFFKASPQPQPSAQAEATKTPLRDVRQKTD